MLKEKEAGGKVLDLPQINWWIEDRMNDVREKKKVRLLVEL